jgi:hypothetical protein
MSIWDILLNDPTARVVDAGANRTTFDDIYKSKLPTPIGQASYPEQRLFSGYTSPDIRARQASRLLYEAGLDHYTGTVNDGQTGVQEATEWLNARNGRPTVGPWSSVFGHDRENTLARMQQDNYNPFLGSEGRWVGDGRQGISEIDGYSDDSIAGWFKNAFAGDDMVKHRREALNTLSSWNGQERHMGGWRDGLGKGINKATERMTEEYFNQMDLANKFGLQWQGGSSNQSASQQANAEALAENALKMGLKAQGSSSGMLSRARDVSDPEWSALSDSNSGSQMGPFMLGQLAKRG